MITDGFDKDKALDFIRTIFTPFSQWERMRHPYAGWTRIALALSFPFVIWSHSLLMIGLYIAAVIVHPLWFSPYVSADEDEPFLTRLVDAVERWMDNASREDKIVAFFPGFILMLPLVAALWSHFFFWSLYFFAALIAYKILFLHRIFPEIMTPFDDNDEDIYHA